MKINFSPIKGGFNLSQINAMLGLIVSHLNNKVLYRDSPSGEPNQMINDLDMNNYKIYNLPAPENDGDAARYKDIKDIHQASLIINAVDLQNLITRVEALEAAVFPPPSP